MRLILLLVLCSMSIVPWGCSSSNHPKDNDDDDKQTASLCDQEWYMVWLWVPGLDAPLYANPEVQPTLYVDNEAMQARGVGSCNGFGATITTLDPEHVCFEGIMSTTLACIEGAKLEGNYWQALEQAQRYAIVGTRLHIYNQEGKQVLELVLPYPAE